MKLWNYLIVIVAVLSAPSCLYTQWGDETEKKPGQESQAHDDVGGVESGEEVDDVKVPEGFEGEEDVNGSEDGG